MYCYFWMWWSENSNFPDNLNIIEMLLCTNKVEANVMDWWEMWNKSWIHLSWIWRMEWTEKHPLFGAAAASRATQTRTCSPPFRLSSITLLFLFVQTKNNWKPYLRDFFQHRHLSFLSNEQTLVGTSDPHICARTRGWVGYKEEEEDRPAAPSPPSPKIPPSRPITAPPLT